MYQDITGIILSGGKSSRMGKNKALLKIGDQSVIGKISGMMKNLFRRVILITNEPEIYTDLRIETFTDIKPGFGPLGGIHSGLTYSSTGRNFIISCDMPFIDDEVIGFIINYPSTKSLIIPKADGFLQQLCGIYSKNLLGKIESKLDDNGLEETRHKNQIHRKCRVHSFIDECDPEIMEMETEYPKYSNDLFFNMNSMEDYKYVLEKFNRK